MCAGKKAVMDDDRHPLTFLSRLVGDAVTGAPQGAVSPEGPFSNTAFVISSWETNTLCGRFRYFLIV
jgi:hypothetical protein